MKLNIAVQLAAYGTLILRQRKSLVGRFLPHEPSDASTSVFPYRFQVSSVSFCHTAAPCQQDGINTITTKGEQEGSLQECGLFCSADAQGRRNREKRPRQQWQLQQRNLQNLQRMAMRHVTEVTRFAAVSSPTSDRCLYQLKPKTESPILSKEAKESSVSSYTHGKKHPFRSPGTPSLMCLHRLSHMPCEWFPAAFLHEYQHAGNIL